MCRDSSALSEPSKNAEDGGSAEGDWRERAQVKLRTTGESEAISRPQAAGENGAILGLKATSENAGRDPVPESEDGPVRSHAPVKTNWSGHKRTGYRLRASGDKLVGMDISENGTQST